MLLFLLLCHTLFIPVINGSDTATPKYPKIIKNSTSVDQEALTTGNFTEGGSTVQSAATSLPHQIHDTALMSLEKDKSVQQSSSSKVVPRKGVVYPVENSTEVMKNVSEVHVTHKGKGETQELSPPSKTNITRTTQSSINVGKTLLELSTKKVLKTTTTRPKKPTILSSEPLDKMIYKTDKKSEVVQVTSTTNNIPSTKKEPMTASRHPGMAMPVVITILVVPMFAVLGYMALRRGKEAWKNRHYKRMDFLLDGMYNE